MTDFIIKISTALVFHAVAINSMSLIAGRYRIGGWKPATKVVFHKYGVAGLLIAILGSVVFEFCHQHGMIEVGAFLFVACLLIDIFFIRSAILRDRR